MVGLGDLPGGEFYSVATGVSSDGSIIVGQATPLSGDGAFIWDEVHGLRSLHAVLEELGVGAALSGWQLTYANGISADGQTIVGLGVNPAGENEGWVATVPDPSADGMLLLSAILARLRIGKCRWKNRRSSFESKKAKMAAAP